MLSVSNLCSYSYCARKFYMESALGIKVPMRKDVMIRGTIRHETEESGIKGQEGIICSLDVNTFSCLDTHFYDLYTKALDQSLLRHASELQQAGIDALTLRKDLLSSVVQMVRFRIQQIQAFATENHLYGLDLWNALLPKVRTELSVTSNALGLRGIVDQLEDYRTHLVPVELKTGSLPQEGVWPSHKIQVACYMMLLNDAMGAHIKRAVVRYVDHMEERSVMLNPFLEMEIRTLLQETERTKTSSLLPPKVELKKKCDSCHLKDICYSDSAMQEAMEKKWGKQEPQKKKSGDLRDFF